MLTPTCIFEFDRQAKLNRFFTLEGVHKPFHVYVRRAPSRMGGAAGRDTIHPEIFQSCFPSIRYVVLQQEVCLRLHSRRDATHAIPTDFQPERLGAVGEPLPDGDVFELGQTGLCAADRQCRLWCIEFVVVDRCVEIVEAAAAGIGLERRLEDDLPLDRLHHRLEPGDQRSGSHEHDQDRPYRKAQNGVRGRRPSRD